MDFYRYLTFNCIDYICFTSVWNDGVKISGVNYNVTYTWTWHDRIFVSFTGSVIYLCTYGMSFISLFLSPFITCTCPFTLFIAMQTESHLSKGETIKTGQKVLILSQNSYNWK